jgi:hypothetical protein
MLRAALRRRAPRTILGLACAAALALGAAGPAGAAGVPQPSGPYTGMGTCPLASPQLQNANDGAVGCVVATVAGGSFTVGSTVVQLPASSPIVAKFGAYWPNNGPTVTFPDGTETDVMSTVAPTDGRELTSSPLNVPIPGLSSFWPGVTTAIVQIELAGPITNFAPLSAGENYPLFRLPVKLHLLNVFLGTGCYIGSSSSPVLLQPTAGTTSPPAPNQPIAGDTGSIGITGDPDGFAAVNVAFTGSRLVDNSFAVPSASGCGLLGSADWIVDSLFGLPSAAGHNTTVFATVNTALAFDGSISDLTSAVNATKH